MPNYKLEIGLKGDTIEYEKEVRADSLNAAYNLACSWAVEEYCIVQATPLDKEGELAEEINEFTKSVRSIVLTMTRQGLGPISAHKFLEHMRNYVSDAIELTNNDPQILTAPGPEDEGSAGAT